MCTSTVSTVFSGDFASTVLADFLKVDSRCCNCFYYSADLFGVPASKLFLSSIYA